MTKQSEINYCCPNASTQEHRIIALESSISVWCKGCWEKFHANSEQYLEQYFTEKDEQLGSSLDILDSQYSNINERQWILLNLLQKDYVFKDLYFEFLLPDSEPTEKEIKQDLNFLINIKLVQVKKEYKPYKYLISSVGKLFLYNKSQEILESIEKSFPDFKPLIWKTKVS